MALIGLLLAVAPGGILAAVADRTDPSVTPLRSLVQQYQSDQAALQRRWPLFISPTRLERMKRFLEDRNTALQGVAYESLPTSSKIDYQLLRTRIGFDRTELQRESAQIGEMAPWLPFGGSLLALLERERGVTNVPDNQATAQAVTKLAGEIGKSADRIKEATKEPHRAAGGKLPTPVIALRTAQNLEQLRRALKEWNEFYAGYDPEFSWWVRQPFEACDRQLGDYAALLRKEVVGEKAGEDAPLVGDPIGREALLNALAAEMIPYSPEELIRIGELEYAWCEREWKKVAREMGFGEDWKKALDHVANLHVRPGAQPRLIRELAEEAVQFLESRELVTIPSLCKEIWRMEMMSPERQKVNPYFTGGEVISVSFPTDSMGHEDKVMSLRGNNIHFCRATVQHELIPGHHLQLFMAARHQTHRELFRTPFLVEGWALYWEMLLWDLGFPRTPEDRVGMLFWRTHRCARIVFSLKFHLGRMKALEAVDYLVDKVGHERRNATAEVRRSIAGGYGPLYQAAYMLGGLQIRSLRRELVDSGKMTDREFHDAILRENAIPIDMIRASLTGSPPPRDYESSWRFQPLKP